MHKEVLRFVKYMIKTMNIGHILSLLSVLLICLPVSASVYTEWTTEYNGPSGYEDRAMDITVDSAGNVYVTGYSWSGVNVYTSDYVTIKYDTKGVQQWTAQYDGPAHYEDSALAYGPGNHRQRADSPKPQIPVEHCGSLAAVRVHFHRQSPRKTWRRKNGH